VDSPGKLDASIELGSKAVHHRGLPHKGAVEQSNDEGLERKSNAVGLGDRGKQPKDDEVDCQAKEGYYFH
jgi:hypothetical protein